MAALVGLMFAGTSLRADIFDHIPATAKLVVVAKDIQTLEKDFRAYAGKLDLPIDPAMFELNSLTVLVGLPAELGQQAALVVTDVTPAGVIIMIELADPEALATLPGLKKVEEDDDDEDKDKEDADDDDDDEEDQEYRTEIQGMPAIVEVEGSLAKIQIGVSDDEGLDAVEDVKNPLSKALTAHQKKILERSDLFFWLNVVEWRALAEQGLNMLQEQMIRGMEQAGGDAAMAATGISMKGYFEWIFNGARTLTKETHSFYGGIAIEPADVHLLLAADYEPGSGMATSFQPASVPVKELLKGLPDHDFLVAGGTDIPSSRKAMTDFSLGVMKSMFMNADPKVLDELKRSMEFLDQSKTMSLLVNMGGKDVFETAGLITSDQPKKLFEKYKENSKNSGQQMALMGLPPIPIEIESKEIGGRPAFEYVVDLSKILPKNDNPEVQEAQEEMYSILYGPDMKLRSQVDLRDHGIGFASSSGANPLALLDSPKSLVDNSMVARSIKALPAEGASVFLFQPAGFLRMFGKMMETQGLPIQVPKIEGTVPPLAGLMEIEKGMTALDLVIPAETTKLFVALGMQAAQGAGDGANDDAEVDDQPAEEDEEKDEPGAP
jgi:hypothetical protein